MSAMTARQEQIAQAQSMVEHLRQQTTLEREKVSVTTKSLLDYVTENEAEDPLINPMAKNENPFIERGNCTIL